MLSDTDKLIAIEMRRKGRSYNDIVEKLGSGCERQDIVRFFSTYTPEPKLKTIRPNALSPDEKYLTDNYEAECKTEAEIAELLWHKRMMGQRWDVRRRDEP